MVDMGMSSHRLVSGGDLARLGRNNSETASADLKQAFNHSVVSDRSES